LQPLFALSEDLDDARFADIFKACLFKTLREDIQRKIRERETFGWSHNKYVYNVVMNTEY
jgi:hypothetical protein